MLVSQYAKHIPCCTFHTVHCEDPLHRRSRADICSQATRYPESPPASSMPGGFIELKEKDSAEAGFAHKPSDGTDEYATAKPRMTEAQRIQAFMDVAATHVEQTTGSKEGGTCLRASAPFISALVWIAVKVAPIYAWLFEKAHWVYEHAPVKVLEMIFGLGVRPASNWQPAGC